MDRLNVLLTGSSGQLGWELQKTVPAHIRIIATDEKTLDITDQRAVFTAVRGTTPNVIINAAAYTAVDKAETETERAYAINAYGPENLAKAAIQSNARLVHISTDFVFDGKQGAPYKTTDSPNPISVYGASKLQGEQRVMASGCDALVLRTAWVYSVHGKNFVKTMLKLMATKDSLAVVGDQIGTPTWARNLAVSVWRAVENNVVGVAHFTDAGVASWYDFAVAIQEEAFDHGLLSSQIPIRMIASSEYPTPARRPTFGLLDKQDVWNRLNMPPLHWRVALREMLSELRIEDL